MKRLFTTDFRQLITVVLVTVLIVFAGAGSAQDKRKGVRAQNFLQGIDRPLWQPNRIADYISNNGQFVTHIPHGRAGLEWPAGSGKTADFAAGIWLAGIQEGKIKTAAAQYITEFQPGNIVAYGSAASPEDPRFRIYTINRGDAEDPLRNPDYLDWPIADGAPADENGNPLLNGESTIWAVFNDLDSTAHRNLFSSDPMGIEVQMTGWAFARPDVLWDMLFFRYRFINKSSAEIDSMFVCLWNDADVGDIRDLAGCDTTLSLAFNYKSQNDDVYGINPPAIGTVLLQGPVVAGNAVDTAFVSGQIIFGSRNLEMTSFLAVQCASAFFGICPENYQEAYAAMNGRDISGSPIIDPRSNQPTNYMYPGDPVAGTGWLADQHGDYRYWMNMGPFQLAVGDTQEVVFALTIAQGKSWQESVTLLKRKAQTARRLYRRSFEPPQPPPSPRISISSTPESLLLTWDRGSEFYRAPDTVGLDSLGHPSEYAFQGYKVYQLDSPVVDDETVIRRIANFDVIDGVEQIEDYVYSEELGQWVSAIVEVARDTGIQRHLRLTVDRLAGEAFILNKKYYFAVTAYGYNPFGIPRTLESIINIVTARTQNLALGSDLSNTSSQGDILAATRVSGISGGAIVPVVLDPAALTGHDYEVHFRKATAGSDSGTTVYDVIDMTTGETKASGFKNQNDVQGTEDYPIVDGVFVKVFGPPLDFTSFQVVANGAGPLDPPAGGAFDFRNFPVPERPSDRQQVGGGKWAIHTADNGGTSGGGTRGTYEAFLDHTTNGGTRWGNIIPFGYEWRFNATGSVAYDPFGTNRVFDVPYELWNIGISTPDDPSDDYKMVPNVLDADADATFNLSNWGPGDGSAANGGGGPEHSASGGNDDPFTDWTYWYTPDDISPGTTGYDTWAAETEAIRPGDDGSYGAVQKASDINMRRMVLINWNGGVAPPFTQDLPEAGTTFRITTTKPNGPADVFRFSTVAPLRDNLTLARQQARELVNVYPNPYDRGNLDLDRPFDRYVTFTHLPEGPATIHIFTIYADLVRKIEHSNGTQFEEWDLTNAHGREVATGVYIVRIDMGAIGVKVLKLAVF